jgi:large subunit ribosomal protein L6
MSRLAKKPVIIPNGVTITQGDRELSVKGPKGELKVMIPANIKVELKPEGAMVSYLDSSKQARANSGTVWSLTQNAIQGVSEGFQKNLEIEGVGYRAAVEGQNLVLNLGYVNPVRKAIPAGLSVTVEKNVIKVAGINKEIVGQFAAQVRKEKKPEPYKGKGIRYQGEIVRRKVGKKAAAAG